MIDGWLVQLREKRKKMFGRFLPTGTSVLDREPGLSWSAPIQDFPPEAWIYFEGARRLEAEPFRLRTPARRWHYAALLPLSPERAPELGARVVVRVRGLVEEGAVGLAALANDKTTIYSERTVTSQDGEFDLQVFVSSWSHLKGLLVRAVSPEERPSVVRITSVQAFEVTFDPIEDARLHASATLGLEEHWDRVYSAETPTSVRQWLRAEHYRRLTDAFVIPWMRGLRAKIYPETEISRALYLSGRYEPNEMTVMNCLIDEGDVVVDVGANLGLYTLIAASKVGPSGRVLAFEPSARENRRLCENVLLNRLPNCTVRAQALGARKEEATLLVGESFHSGHSTLGSGFAYDTKLFAKERVEVTTFDAAADESGLDRIAFIKIDVEGGEGTVLEGATQSLRRFRPLLLLEVSGAHLQTFGWVKGDLARTLEQQGYEAFRIVGSHPSGIEEGSIGRDGNYLCVPVERRDAVKNALRQLSGR